MCRDKIFNRVAVLVAVSLSNRFYSGTGVQRNKMLFELMHWPKCCLSTTVIFPSLCPTGFPRLGSPLLQSYSVREVQRTYGHLSNDREKKSVTFKKYTAVKPSPTLEVKRILNQSCQNSMYHFTVNGHGVFVKLQVGQLEISRQFLW